MVYQECFSHFPTIPDHFGRFPKTNEDSRRLPKSSEDVEDYRTFPRRNPNIFDYISLLYSYVKDIFFSVKIRFFSVREILQIHSYLYNNRILFIIKIGYNAEQKWQINVIPSLSKAHGYVPYLIVQMFLQIKAKMSADGTTDLLTVMSDGLLVGDWSSVLPRFHRILLGIGRKKSLQHRLKVHEPIFEEHIRIYNAKRL